MLSSQFYILSKIPGPLFIGLLIETHLRAGISKKVASLMKSGNPRFTSPPAGASLRSAS